MSDRLHPTRQLPSWHVTTMLIHNVLDAFFILLFLALLTHAVRQYVRCRSRNPPGPRGYWFTGNAYQIPKDKQWLKFDEWIKAYGAAFRSSILRDQCDVERSLLRHLSVFRRYRQNQCHGREHDHSWLISSSERSFGCTRDYILRQTESHYGRRIVSPFLAIATDSK